MKNAIDTFDSAWVLRLYAAAAALAGALLLGWGPLWMGAHLADQRYGKAALIRLAGAVLIALACAAYGMAGVEDPVSRRRGLLWFLAGHGVLLLGAATQQAAVWGNAWPAPLATGTLALVSFSLFYGWMATAETSGDSPYERQIRAAARQEERHRLARDLHDSVKQQIFAIQTAAATAQVRLESGQAGVPEALDQVRNSAREAATEMAAMLDQLRAAPLENAGLIAAIRQQCEALGFRTGARVDIRIGTLPPAPRLPAGTHEALLRVTQETLSNIARHARAGQVELALDTVGPRVELRVRDDGAGFDPAQAGAGGGQGLRNTHARAAELGGTFTLSSRPGAGTLAVFSLPYVQAEPSRVYAARAAGYLAVLAALAVAIFYWGKDALMFPAVVTLFAAMRNAVAWRRVARGTV